MKYEKKDVIMWQDDTRLKDGDKYYIGINADDVLIRANSPDESPKELISHNKVGGFQVKSIYSESLFVPVLIKARKETQKKIVPFDFYLKEDRNAVIGKCLIRKHSGNPDDEFMVVGFSENAACFSRDIVDAGNNILDHYGTGKELFEQFSFQNGDPVGKEVEE